MDFYNDLGVWIFLYRGIEHALKGGVIRHAIADRRIAIGLIDNEHTSAARCGIKPQFLGAQKGCVVGWGLKSTSNKARKLAKKTDKSYIAMEDGFIRSVVPGPGEIPVSLVVDHSGVYYDAADASDLEKLIVASARDMSPCVGFPP